MNENLYLLIALIVGCVSGSFLNVVGYRLPANRNIVTDRSRCPNCERQIAWYDNIPILSYLMLKGRCRNCNWKIPFSYPLAEIGTGLVFMLVVREFSFPQAIGWLFLSSLLIACALSDFYWRIIPDVLTLPGICIGIVFTLLVSKTSVSQSFLRSIVGVIVGGGTLFGVGLIYKILRGVEGMGGGDVKLMAMVGAFLGYKLALFTIFLGSLIGSIFAIVLLSTSGIQREQKVPFGVFLAPCGIIAMLWGENLIQVYLNLVR